MKKVSLVLMGLLTGVALTINGLKAETVVAQSSPADSAIGTIEGAATIKGVEALDNPEQALARTVEVVLDIVFGVAVLLVLANLIWGAYLWIMSGGDSGKLQAARNRMIFSIVGLLLVAAAWPLTKIIQDLLVSPDNNTSIIKLE